MMVSKTGTEGFNRKITDQYTVADALAQYLKIKDLNISVIDLQYNNFDHEELTMPAQFPLGLYHSEEGSSQNSFVLKMTPSTVSL